MLLRRVHFQNAPRSRGPMLPWEIRSSGKIFAGENLFCKSKWWIMGRGGGKVGVRVTRSVFESGSSQLLIRRRSPSKRAHKLFLRGIVLSFFFLRNVVSVVQIFRLELRWGWDDVNVDAVRLGIRWRKVEIAGRWCKARLNQISALRKQIRFLIAFEVALLTYARSARRRRLEALEFSETSWSVAARKTENGRGMVKFRNLNYDSGGSL